MIAEPWDVGPGGYQVGNFPVRAGRSGTASIATTLRTILEGRRRRRIGVRHAPDRFQRSLRAERGRTALRQSVNFVTCHDGFSLRDLVTYNHKHNEANGEGGRDGADNNDSWNCGHEGETDDARLQAFRGRQRRNFVATMLLSQGVPMLLAGDELGHTQHGNNNTYCQDNELSWLDWSTDPEKANFLEFVKTVTRIWREQPVFQRRNFLLGRSIRGEGVTDITWFSPTGQDMDDNDWGGHVKCLGLRLAGDLIGEHDERGETIVGDTILVLMNAHHEALPFTLPVLNKGHRWERLFDTADDLPAAEFDEGEAYTLKDRSLVLFRTVVANTTEPRPTDLQMRAVRKEADRAGAPALLATR